MKKFLKISAALVFTAGSTVLVQAGSIGVNVGPNSGTIGEGNARLAPENNELPATTEAGVVPQANWNNLLGGSISTPVQLTDESGTLLATTATVTTQWTNGVQDHGSSDGDQILMNGGVDNGGGNQFATIVGIPYEVYDVYIYFDGGHSGPTARFGEYSATPSGAGASEAQSQVGYDDGTFDGTFIRETGNEDGNYILFEGMSGPDLVINSVAQNPTTPRAPWNGFQIVEVGGSSGGGLEITEIDYDATSDSATLTWRANPNLSYAVFASTDLIDWSSQVATGVDAEADENPGDEGLFTTTISLPGQGFTGAPKLFFRVEETD